MHNDKQNQTAAATVEVWAKPLPGHKVAILVLNVGPGEVKLSLSASADVPGQPRGATMRHVWDHTDVPIPGGQIPVALAEHDSMMAVLSETSDDWFLP